jgi:trk system potassium uptake protein TrkA
MFAGRTGTITFASALALRERRRLYRLPRSDPSLARNGQDDAVLVVGLGRFGSAVADALARLGHEVLAIDSSAELVQTWSSRLTHVVQADATSEATMRQLGRQDFKGRRRGDRHRHRGEPAHRRCARRPADPTIWGKAITLPTGASSSASACTMSCTPSSPWASASPTS